MLPLFLVQARARKLASDALALAGGNVTAAAKFLDLKKSEVNEADVPAHDLAIDWLDAWDDYAYSGCLDSRIPLQDQGLAQLLDHRMYQERIAERHQRQVQALAETPMGVALDDYEQRQRQVQEWRQAALDADDRVQRSRISAEAPETAPVQDQDPVAQYRVWKRACPPKGLKLDTVSRETLDTVLQCDSYDRGMAAARAIPFDDALAERILEIQVEQQQEQHRRMLGAL